MVFELLRFLSSSCYFRISFISQIQRRDIFFAAFVTREILYHTKCETMYESEKLKNSNDWDGEILQLNNYFFIYWLIIRCNDEMTIKNTFTFTDWIIIL